MCVYKCKLTLTSNKSFIINRNPPPEKKKKLNHIIFHCIPKISIQIHHIEVVTKNLKSFIEKKRKRKKKIIF